MFIEFRTTNAGNSGGIQPFGYLLDYAMANNTASFNTAQSGLEFCNVWADANPGNWERRQNNGDFTAAGNYWAWSQPVIGKSTDAFFHKGFALRLNTISSETNNYFNGFMGSFQNPADKTAFGAFDFGRPLNVNLTTASIASARYDTLNSSGRYVYRDRYVFAAGTGYLFIGNLDQATFWAVCDATALPIHQYSTSASIPMVGLSGLGDTSTSLTRHDLHVSVHKYDSGSGATYNQLSSFSQRLASDQTSANNSVNFLNLYPYSLANQGFLDRFDVDGKKSTAIYPIIIGNPVRGNAYQTVEGLVILSGQNHETGQTFYVGNNRYYKFVCTHDRTTRASAFAGLTIGVPIR